MNFVNQYSQVAFVKSALLSRTTLFGKHHSDSRYMKAILIVNYVKSSPNELMSVYESQESMNDSSERVGDDPRAEISSIRFNIFFLRSKAN